MAEYDYLNDYMYRFGVVLHQELERIQETSILDKWDKLAFDYQSVGKHVYENLALLEDFSHKINSVEDIEKITDTDIWNKVLIQAQMSINQMYDKNYKNYMTGKLLNDRKETLSLYIGNGIGTNEFFKGLVNKVLERLDDNSNQKFNLLEMSKHSIDIGKKIIDELPCLKRFNIDIENMELMKPEKIIDECIPILKKIIDDKYKQDGIKIFVYKELARRREVIAKKVDEVWQLD